MHYEIVEISTETRTEHTYVLVHFWASRADAIRNEPPILVNDFLMQLRSTAERVVTDEQGRYKRTDGVFVAPEDVTGKEEWIRETVKQDVPAKIIENIERYIARAETRGDRGNHLDHRNIRDMRDPHHILERVDVRALRGTRRNRSVRASQ